MEIHGESNPGDFHRMCMSEWDERFPGVPYNCGMDPAGYLSRERKQEILILWTLGLLAAGFGLGWYELGFLAVLKGLGLVVAGLVMAGAVTLMLNTGSLGRIVDRNGGIK